MRLSQYLSRTSIFNSDKRVLRRSPYDLAKLRTVSELLK